MTLKIKYNLLKWLMVLSLAFSMPVFVLADDAAPALFEKANTQFAKANYKEAIASYQQIITENYQSAAVYFNLGNAYYKTGDIPSALLYYGKAHKIAPGDDDINFNTRFVNAKTIDKVDEPQQLFILNWWDTLILSFPVHTLAVVSVFLVLIGFAALIFYLFTRSVVLKRASFYGALTLIFSGLVTIFIANRQNHYFDSHHEAIVFGSTIKVKSGPADASKDLFVIHEGTKVEVQEKQADWTKISLANGNTGWIKLGDVKEI